MWLRRNAGSTQLEMSWNTVLEARNVTQHTEPGSLVYMCVYTHLEFGVVEYLILVPCRRKSAIYTTPPAKIARILNLVQWLLVVGGLPTKITVDIGIADTLDAQLYFEVPGTF